VAAAVFGWVFDRERAPIRLDAVRRSGTSEYLSLSKQRNQRVRQRGTVVAAGIVLVTAGVWVFTATAPDWAQAGLLVLVVAALGVVGTTADRRVLDPATVSPLAPPRLSADSVTRALRALGVSGMTGKDAELSFPAPITRDGPAWRADVDLTHGVTPAMVMEKRAELASGLRRPSGVYGPNQPGTSMPAGWCCGSGDQDLARARQPGWPLARTGSADLFTPVPFGTDQRGRTVTVTLMFSNMVIGSIPRMGKTFSARLLLLAAALDPISELHAFDLKGMGDFSALEPVAHAYRAGDDAEDIAYDQQRSPRSGRRIRPVPVQSRSSTKITRLGRRVMLWGLWG
jgi:S-DNA-T family DNA segregation ATPase FtsK/SpoIIIE